MPNRLLLERSFRVSLKCTPPPSRLPRVFLSCLCSSGRGKGNRGVFANNIFHRLSLSFSFSLSVCLRRRRRQRCPCINNNAIPVSIYYVELIRPVKLFARLLYFCLCNFLPCYTRRRACPWDLTFMTAIATSLESRLSLTDHHFLNFIFNVIVRSFV